METTYLNSAILGYLIFSFIVWNKTNKSGKHFRIGIPLTIIGFFIVKRINKTKLNKKAVQQRV